MANFGDVVGAVVTGTTHIEVRIARLHDVVNDQVAPRLANLVHLLTDFKDAYTAAVKPGGASQAVTAAASTAALGGSSADAIAKAITEAIKAANKKPPEEKSGGGLVGVLTALPRAIFAAEAAILGFGRSMLGMVAKANPAAAQRWELAVNDLLAVLGNALLPVFELVTQLVRTMADAFTLLIPVGSELAAALQPVFQLIGEALAGAIGYLAGALKAVVPVVGVLVRVLMDAANWVGKLVKEFLSFLGIDISPDEARKGAATGMAARQAQIGGVEDVLKRAMSSAFSSGLGAGDPASKTASAAESIRKRTDEIYAWLTNDMPGKFAAWFEALPGKLADAIRNGAAAVGRAAGDAVANGIFGTGSSSVSDGAAAATANLRQLDNWGRGGAPASNLPPQLRGDTMW